MNYSDEIILRVKELAKLPDYTRGMVARILNIPESDIRRSGELCDAFDAGKLEAKGEFGKKVAQLSNQGSGPAQSLMKNLFTNTEINEYREYYG